MGFVKKVFNLKALLLAVIFINVFFSVWYVIHGDIYFHTDIARDFLLLDDLAKRKIVLIGPRSSNAMGLYHGPLWMYLNFPAFLIGRGNPVAVGWFWVVLNIAFLATSYIIARRLFNSKVALIFTALLSLFPSLPNPERGWLNAFYNPHGALFLMPFFFYSLYCYLKTARVKWLLLTLLLNGCIFQFQLAFGGPLLILTGVLIFYSVFKKRKFSHLLSFAVLLIPFSTYILFDLRHDFSHVKAVLYLVTHSRDHIPLLDIVRQRFEMIGRDGLHFFREPYTTFGLAYAAAMIFGLYTVYKSKSVKDKLPYILGIIIYFGFFALSCLYNGWLMYYYWMPIYPVPLLIFASLEPHLPKKVFYPLLFASLLFNIGLSFNLLNNSKNYIGKVRDDWKFQSSIARKVFADANGHEFGFYIYSPDIFAYETKYPFAYYSRINPQVSMHIYERMPLTYIVMAPPPKEKPWMTGNWWLKNKVGIVKQPDSTYTYANGYKIMKFTLNKQDLEIPTDPNLNDWIYFR